MHTWCWKQITDQDYADYCDYGHYCQLGQRDKARGQGGESCERKLWMVVKWNIVGDKIRTIFRFQKAYAEYVLIG